MKEVMPIVKEKELHCFADGVSHGKSAGKIFTQKNKTLVCPQCGEEIISFKKISLISRPNPLGLRKQRIKVPNFCPNCGAQFASGYALKFANQANEESEKNSEMIRKMELDEYLEQCENGK